jgi:hypothetical protein
MLPIVGRPLSSIGCLRRQRSVRGMAAGGGRGCACRFFGGRGVLPGKKTPRKPRTPQEQPTVNYLAHGWHFLDAPHVLAGTAAPDWLCVADRRLRLRPRNMLRWLESADAMQAELARGVLRHHADDAWFHQAEAFTTLQLRFAVLLRELLVDDEGFRPGFVGHVLVELMLDAALAEEQPSRLAAYYHALETLDPPAVAAALVPMATRLDPVDGQEVAETASSRLATLIARFLEERFLYDYADDAKLLARLNRVLARVGLAALPEDAAALFPSLRRQVWQQRRVLLPAA